MMSRYGLYRLSGYLSIAAGIAGVMSIYKPQFLFFGMAISVAGFALATVNIVLNAKHDYEGEKYPMGYWGLFLCSLPVLFMLLMLFRFGN